MDVPSIEQIVQTIFGGNISIQAIVTLLMPIYAVVISIVEWRSKIKLIKADKQLTSADKKLDAQAEELKAVKESMKYLGDMICTAYLANVNVPEQTKKQIAESAIKLEKVADIQLSSMTTKLLDTVIEYVPETNISQAKEDIIASTKVAEQIIDTASETANDIVDKLEV